MKAFDEYTNFYQNNGSYKQDGIVWWHSEAFQAALLASPQKAHTEHVSLGLRRSRLEALESPGLAGGFGKPGQWGHYQNKILEETCAELPAEGDSESAGILVDPKAVEPHLPHLWLRRSARGSF